ncbi:MAG TPA: hypothetical protein VFY06_08015 [Verrucomicrobiae bacterium]|nr:hypothetical protein [Verrucomicrobiae bacterium]
MKREFISLIAVWLVLAAILTGVGEANLSSPGLYYDEAVFAGLAKDFLTGHAPGNHMPGVLTVNISGAPFPLFVQPYLGAVKCWLLLPAFKVFGATLKVLRATNLFLSVIALLIFMLWTWRWLGLATALLAGALLALDPAFVYACGLDWGSLLPSMLCRFAGFFLVLLAWRRQRALWAFLSGVVFGLGFFNKIDFAVLLAGTGLAAACAYGKPATRFLLRPRIGVPLILGFLLGAGPMLLALPFIISTILTQGAPGNPGELAEKIQTLFAMYDGSYFYRLMDAGGLFDKMYEFPPPVWTPFGALLLAAAGVWLAGGRRPASDDPNRRTGMFLILATGFVTLGVLILPGAVRIHHATLVYPFPHLIIAVCVVSLWKQPWKTLIHRRIAHWLTAALLLLLAACECFAIARTRHLIHETGGRGWWSDALVRFSSDVKDRPGLVIVSLDWGFNEQLEFLTDAPRLEESFWKPASGTLPELPRDAHHLYLAYPPKYSLSPLGAQFMASVARENPDSIIQPWRDRQGRIVFYSITFPKP